MMKQSEEANRESVNVYGISIPRAIELCHADHFADRVVRGKSR